MNDTNPLSPEDRKLVDALATALADPNTPADKRTEYREELDHIASMYAAFDCLTDDEQREYLASRNDG